MLLEIGGWIEVGYPPRHRHELQLLACCCDQPTQRPIGGIPVPALVRRDHWLRRPGPPCEAALRQPGAAANGLKKLGWFHAASIYRIVYA